MTLKKILCGFFLLFYLNTSAQKIILGGEETSRLLTWDDFRGKPDKDSTFFAFTFWNISARYDAFLFRGDTVDWKVTVVYELGKDSWKKKDKLSDSLLRHEQDMRSRTAIKDQLNCLPEIKLPVKDQCNGNRMHK